MVEEAAEEDLPAFDLLDFIKEDEDLFVPVIRVKLEVGIRDRGQVGDTQRKKPVIFKVDIKETLAGNGSDWVGAKMIDKLIDKVSFPAAAGTGDDNNRGGTVWECGGESGRSRGKGCAIIRQLMISFYDPGRFQFMKLLNEELKGFFMRFHERKGGKSKATSFSLA